MSSFENKSFVVTGGASGIGLAVVRKLIAVSANVHVVDIVDSAPSDIDDYPKGYFYGSVDISSRSAVTAAYQIIFERTPEIHGLVNCAGICTPGGGLIQDDDHHQRTMAVNVNGTWNMTTALLRHLDARIPDTPNPPVKANASIVNIGSSASMIGFPTLAAYCASKHAVLGMTRSWALDWARKGIKVNVVAPGAVRTPLAAAQLGDLDAGRGATLHETLKFIPQKRISEPEEQADAVLFLLGDNSSYITGQVIPVNGGYP
jgi:NAD(P)-dependent dehydrogenase (short-subunit alcohol dehydrogenase family)